MKIWIGKMPWKINPFTGELHYVISGPPENGQEIVNIYVEDEDLIIKYKE